MDYLKLLLSSIDNQSPDSFDYDSQSTGYTTFILSFCEALMDGKTVDEWKTLFTNFMSAQTHADRMKLIQNDPYFSGKLDSMYSMIVENASKSEPKNETEAIESLQKGMQLVEQSDNISAFEYFSTGIENSKIKSQTFSECLAGRGYCLYFGKYFKDAYQDIIEALETNQSPKNVPRLLIMKGKCLMKMNEKDEAQKIFTDVNQTIVSANYLTKEIKRKLFEELQTAQAVEVEEGNYQYVNVPLFEEDAKFPGFKSSLRIFTDEKKGRYVKSNEGLKKGTIVISENATGFWLAPGRYEECCNFCMKTLAMRYVSCRECKAVRYCSLVCEDTAWTQYHSVECPHLDILKYFSSHHASLRLVIRYGFKKILKTIEDGTMPLQFFCDNGMPANYTSLYSLFGHESDLNFGDLFGYCIGSLLLMRVAEAMRLIERNADEYCTFAGVLLKQMFQITTNCFSLTNSKFTLLRDLNIYVNHGDETKLGMGLFLSSSLLSHSCDYNCDRYTLGNQMVMVLNRDIIAGEELTVTYMSSYKFMSVKDRQAFLQKYYQFTCNCNACENKWENVHYAFKCPNCSGALIRNEDKTAYCTECHVDFSGMPLSIFDGQDVQNYSELARMLMKKKHIDAALKCLENALAIKKMTNYSIVSELEIRKDMFAYFTIKGDLIQMLGQCIALGNISKEFHGSESLETVSYMITATTLLLLIVIFNDSPETAVQQVTTARSLFRAAISVLNNIKGREMNVISDYLAAIFTLIPTFRTMLIDQTVEN